MITDARRSVCVSSLGWVDRGSLWLFEASESDGRPKTVRISDARYLRLQRGEEDHFSVLHQIDDGRIEITVHRFEDPAQAIAGITVDPYGRSVWGAPEVWTHVPTHYTGYFSGPAWSGACLVRLNREGDVELQQFGWHATEYDVLYQGIVGVTEIPGGDLVVISIQRDSRPLVYDPAKQERVGRLTLADRGGNPSVTFARQSDAVWVDDYDTLLRLEARTWRILESRRLQGSAPRTRHFMGSFWISPNEDVCLVPRPFSGDVLELDPTTLHTKRTCTTGGQPLEAATLADGSLVARDWKSGGLLTRTWGQ